MTPALLGWACLGASCDDAGIGPRVVATITVTPAQLALVAGQNEPLIAIVRDEHGVAFSGASVTWQSSNPQVASVSAAGVVGGVAAGSAEITATSGDATGTAAVTVQARPTIVLAPTALSFAATAGGSDPSAQSISVTDGAGGSIADLAVGRTTYGASQPTGWLRTSLSSTSTMLSVQVSIAGVPVGAYEATVDLLSATADNSPQVLAVTLVVNP